MSDRSPRRVAVLGAGLTGLTAAYELRKRPRHGAPPEVVLFEAQARVGGKIRTESHDGVCYEAGTESFTAEHPQALELVRELGLDKDLIHADARRRGAFIVCGGRLHRLPEGLRLAIPTRALPLLCSDLLTWKGKLRLAWEPFVPSLEGEADESLAAFFGRRLGPEAVAKFVAPLLEDVYAGDASQLSLRSTFPQFSDMDCRGGLILESRRGRIVRAAAEADASRTLKRGLSLLSEVLAKRLPSGALRLGAGATRLSRRGAEWEVRTASGGETFDAVVSALPAPALAEVVDALDPELSGMLREIPCASSAVVNLAYEKKTFPHPLDAYGLLVPKEEGRRMTAAVFTSTKFPGQVPADVVLVRCRFGGAGRDGDALGEESQLARAARAELRDLLGLGEVHPRWTRVACWPRSHPQYTVGHGLRLKRIESCLRSHPGLLLAGDSYRGVEMSDRIRSGRQAASRALSGGGGRALSGVF